MAHFAVIAPPLPGHFNPLLSLAAELVARDHSVTFVQMPDAAELVSGAGIGFHAIGAATHPRGWLSNWVEPMAKLGPIRGVRPMLRRGASIMDMICREAPAALREIGADAVIVDQTAPEGGLVAEHLGLPFVSVANALPANREPGVPPIYLGSRYDRSERGRRRNENAYKIGDWLMRGAYDVLEHHSRCFGLTPRRLYDDCWSRDAQISQCIAGLDFPHEELPSSFHYLGPFRRDQDEEWAIPGRNGRPLVFCSLGSLQGSRFRIFRAVAAACERLDLQLLIAHGGRLNKAQVARLPGRPLVHSWVPQRAVLRQTALAVTHAGFNTVMDALTFGTPLIAIPLAFEQPATGARIEFAGVGRALSPNFLTAGRVEAAIRQVLGDASFRDSAQRLAGEIATAGGVRRAADIVEAILS